MWVEPDRERFDKARQTEWDPSPSGIGTYQEKRLHAILKHYVCPDERCHEISVGPYVADVRCGDEIFEIQTGGFYPMREKIRYYLEETDCRVTILHPLPARKWVIWVDPESGETSARHRSPRRGTPLSALSEIFWLSEYLPHPRLRIALYLMEMEEYRNRDGWGREGKRGSHRREMLPLALQEVCLLSGTADYRALLPDSLGESFTSAQFARAVGLGGRRLSAALKLLCTLGVLERGKRTREGYHYDRKGERGDEYSTQ